MVIFNLKCDTSSPLIFRIHKYTNIMIDLLIVHCKMNVHTLLIFIICIFIGSKHFLSISLLVLVESAYFYMLRTAFLGAKTRGKSKLPILYQMEDIWAMENIKIINLDQVIKKMNLFV